MTTAIIAVILTCGAFSGTWAHLNWHNRNRFAGPGIGLGTILVLLLACYLLGWI